MSEEDFTILNSSMSESQVRRSASRGFDPPNGGGNSVFAMNSTTNATGVVGYYYNGPSFNPSAANVGILVSCALKRGPSGGSLGWAPFIFTMLQGNSVSDVGYILGLADGEPAHLVLRKGSLSTGLPDVAPGAQGVLRRGTSTYPNNTWVHVQVSARVNPGSDVVIKCKINHGSIATPTWEDIPGMEMFVDDMAAIASGSPPLTSGRGGFAAFFQESTRRAFFDGVRMTAQ